jgi:hypothetical protein
VRFSWLLVLMNMMLDNGSRWIIPCFKIELAKRMLNLRLNSEEKLNNPIGSGIRKDNLEFLQDLVLPSLIQESIA